MHITISKFIAAPIDITFDVFSDISKTEERIESIKKIDILSDVKQGKGTRWRETRVLFGREATEEMEISAFKPNKSYQVIASSNGMEYQTSYTFTSKNQGIQVKMVFSGTPTTFMAKLMSPLGYIFKNATKTALEADMDSLKAVAEKLSAQQ